MTTLGEYLRDHIGAVLYLQGGVQWNAGDLYGSLGDSLEMEVFVRPYRGPEVARWGSEGAEVRFADGGDVWARVRL